MSDRKKPSPALEIDPALESEDDPEPPWNVGEAEFVDAMENKLGAARALMEAVMVLIEEERPEIALRVTYEADARIKDAEDHIHTWLMGRNIRDHRQSVAL
jgi:hypothetical protein